MRKPVDHTGDRFGKLVLLRYAGFRPMADRNKNHLWLCRCDCGKTKVIAIRNMQCGGTKSCGCMHVGHPKHGLSGDQIYRVWGAMKGRCNNPRYAGYKNYGGRGISYDPRWNDFGVFMEEIGNQWADGLEIDRIDNNGNYTKENCRWVTRSENQNNKRNNAVVEINGIKKTKTQWMRSVGLPRASFDNRIGLGWSVERTLDTPLRRFSHPRTNRLVSVGKDTMTIAQWSKKTGVPYSTIYGRIMDGLCGSDAIYGAKCA
jgi:hypothetical protein